MVDLIPGTAGGLSVTYTQTDQLGIYVATPIAAPVPSGSPGTSNHPSPSVGPAGSGSPSGAAPTAGPSGGQGQGADPRAAIRFAVDLFDVDESAIAPGSNRVLEDLGTARPVVGASGAPRASGAPGNAADPTATRPNARDELWIPIVLIVLVGLCIEWSLYHRDAVLRAWRGLRGRLRRPDRSET
jgi:hypothetical protein